MVEFGERRRIHPRAPRLMGIAATLPGVKVLCMFACLHAAPSLRISPGMSLHGAVRVHFDHHRPTSASTPARRRRPNSDNSMQGVTPLRTTLDPRRAWPRTGTRLHVLAELREAGESAGARKQDKDDDDDRTDPITRCLKVREPAAKRAVAAVEALERINHVDGLYVHMVMDTDANMDANSTGPPGPRVSEQAVHHTVMLGLRSQRYDLTARAFAALNSGALIHVPIAYKTYKEALTELMHSGHYDEALDILGAMIREVKVHGNVSRLARASPTGLFRFDHPLFNKLLNTCASRSRIDVLTRILELMKSAGVSKSAITYCTLVKAYGRALCPEAVELILEDMRAKRVPVDIVTLNTAIDAFVRCGRLNTARNILVALRRSAIQSRLENPGGRPIALAPVTKTYNILIKGYGRAGDLETAFALRRDMENLSSTIGVSCLPDAVTINTLVDACARAGDLGTAFVLLGNGVSSPRRGRSPGTTTKGSTRAAAAASVEGYTSVLRELVRRGDMQRALGLLETMKMRKVPPNGVSYTVIIKGYASQGHMEQAWQYFNELRRSTDSRKRPSIVSYNAMVQGECEHGTLSRALQLLEDMTHEGFRPDACTVNLLIRTIVREGDMEKAMRIFLSMLERGPAPDQVTYSLLIEGFSQAYRHGDARRIFEQARAATERGELRRESITLNSYLKACGRAHQVSEAAAILADAIARRRDTKASAEGSGPQEHDLELRYTLDQPDVVSFTIVISALAVVDSPNAGRRAMSLYRGMRDVLHIPPDKEFVHALFNAIVSARSRDSSLSFGAGELAEVVADLKELRWSAADIDECLRPARRALAAISEAWKLAYYDFQVGDTAEASAAAAGGSEPPGAADTDAAGSSLGDKIFRDHGWNEVDSSFRLFSS